jgi:C-terminal processing protease CtpA/Prc
MKRPGFGSFLAAALCLSFAQLALAQTNSAPDFKEVYDLVRSHLPGVTEAELNRAAVKGLTSALAPRVSLVSKAASSTESQKALVTKSNLFDGKVAYVRVGRVDDDLDKVVRAAYEQLANTNKLKGLVLDLRYADGNSYAAAAATADLFAGRERPLLDWGNGIVRSKPKTDAISMPVAVLVNHQTAGAAEALAAVLRETGWGMLLGAPTAGRAMIAKEFPLSDGEKLRIATSPILLADGSALPANGLQPDITVQVSPQDERAYYTDPFKKIASLSQQAAASLSTTNQSQTTNRAARRRFPNEADLVRERREGLTLDTDVTAENAEPERPVVQDPALARALDLLKGLAVVRQSRS